MGFKWLKPLTDYLYQAFKNCEFKMSDSNFDANNLGRSFCQSRSSHYRNWTARQVSGLGMYL